MIMRKRVISGLVSGFLLALALITGLSAPTAAAAPQSDAGVLVTTLTYDDSLAAEFTTAVAQGVAAWNQSVSNVRLVRATAGTRANIRVIADNNWPRATLGPVRPGGSGTVWMGRQAVQQGYNAVRIAAHEFGHILGLPDVKPGPCSSLMSGSSAGTSCTNQFPNATERARVERNYSSGLASWQPSGAGTVVVDVG
jgi:snapalysin